MVAFKVCDPPKISISQSCRPHNRWRFIHGHPVLQDLVGRLVEHLSFLPNPCDGVDSDIELQLQIHVVWLFQVSIIHIAEAANTPSRGSQFCACGSTHCTGQRIGWNIVTPSHLLVSLSRLFLRSPAG